MTNVNRRIGSISECESWWSIGQKFSYLNSVPFSAFIFLVQVDKEEKGKCRTYHPYMVENIDAKKVSALLGESVQIFSLSGDNIYVPALLKGFRSIISDFRYCPKCLALGFHSPVHQLIWFDKCLLHGCELDKGCPTCGKTLSYSADEYPNHRINRYHCDCGSPIWGDLQSLNWRIQIDRKALQPVFDYLEWIKHWPIPGKDSFAMALEFLRGGGRHDHFVDVAWVMKCLSSISDAPQEVRAALGCVYMPDKHHIKCSGTELQTVVAAISQFGYKQLLTSYRYWYEQTNLVPIMLPLAKSIRNSLLRGHTRCFNRQSCLAITGQHHFYGDTKCYCIHVRNALIFENHWTTLHDDRVDSYERELAHKIADLLGDIGLVSHSRNSEKKYDKRWSSCGRTEFVVDYAMNVHVNPILSQLMDRLWAMEMFKFAYILNSDTKGSARVSSRPFWGFISNPLILIEAGSVGTLNIWIWPRLPLVNPSRHVGARELRRHQAQVARFTTEDEAKLLERGRAFERMNRL